MRHIRIQSGEISVTATIDDSATAEAIWNALPLEASANTWGHEIYFRIPVQVEETPEAREIVEVGELGYWPPGQAFCIFFGRTPASQGEEPRAASPVNVFGRVEDDATQFQAVSHGARITLEWIE